MTDLRRHIPQVALTWDDEAPGQGWRVIDGTLVFADISGFTALTERLSKRGRIGAEEIVETLNRVFGGMLDTAATRGADLLKFGGDALLFLFRGEGHAERACAAAAEMRIALRDAASVPTSVGRLRLAMSVGIHSGEIHLFLVGEPTRELVVLGPGATQTADAEKAANAGEIVVTSGTASRLGPGATRPREDGALLLRRRAPIHPADGRPSPLGIDNARMRSLFPHALGEYLDPGPPEPEHRLATIAFARFAGTDAMLAERGPQAVADAVHAIVTRAQECLDAEGITLLATDLGSDGSAFFLASGVPQSTEDDEGRMLRALRRLVDSELPLPVQAGVNRGHVFVAEVGASSRAAFSAMGDTTNTAARIMSKAGAGLLYAHPVVLEHSRTLFTTTPAGPFAMKGKAVPLLVYDVGEEAGTRDVSDQGRLPLLGRDAELAVVHDAIVTGLSGAGGVLTVSGTTGMGKSRIVREAIAGIDAATVVTVLAEPYGASSSYRVFRDPVRRLLGVERDAPHMMSRALLETLQRAAPDLLPMAPLIADLVQVEVPATPEADAIDPQFRPDRLADVLVQLFATLLPGQVIFVAEEAHWADMASARLLDRLALATAGRPWALIAVRRGTDGGFLPATGVSVTLGPLPDDVVERLVIEATEAAPLRPHEVQAIVHRAEGNPLFVEEATKVARASGSLDQIPESLQAAMAAQIDLLDPTTRRTLRYASVLGRSFRRKVLNETLASDGLAIDPATISSLSGYLEADGSDELRFRNSLLRDAAYEELAYRTRARLHRAAGLAVEAMSIDRELDAPTLSLHFSRAGDDERTWRYALLAGQVARRSYANTDAATQYELALSAARRLPVPAKDLVEAWSVLGELRMHSGQFDEAVDAYRRGAELAKNDPVTLGDLLNRRARVLERAGSRVAALRMVTRTRRLLEGRDDDAALGVLVRLEGLNAVIRLGQERPKEARESAVKAVAAARLMNDSRTLVQALMAIDHADLFLGVQVEGTYTKEALDICIAEGYRLAESIARTNLGNFAFYAGRWGEAVIAYQLSRQAAIEAGNDFGAAETDVNLGEILVNLGRIEEAEPILRDAVRVLRVSGVEDTAAYGEMQLARISLARGQLDEADRLITALVEEFTAMGTRLTALEASLVKAAIANEAGEHERALRLVRDAELAAKGQDAPLRARAQLQRATALLALDRQGECEHALASGLESAREQGLLYEEALLLAVSAQLARQRGIADVAEADASAAERILAQLGSRT